VSRPSAAKRQREKDRRERAEAKAARRLERGAAAPESDDAPVSAADEAALLAALAEVHARFDDGDLDYDDFVAAKDDITRRLTGG
jgi:hypothetical protein